MADSQEAIEGVFVTARGDAWATGLTVGIGGVAGAAAGVAADKRTERAERAATLKRGELGYLSVTQNTVRIGKAKRGAFKPKVTGEVIAEAPRSGLQASRYKRGKLVGVFELDFADGSQWAFDVGKAFAGSATKVAQALGSDVS